MYSYRRFLPDCLEQWLLLAGHCGKMTESDEERGARRPSYSTGEEDGSVSSSDDVDGDDDDDGGESLDFVSELTPLFAGGHHPLVVDDVDDEHDDDGRVDGRRSTTRLPRKLSDDDSIHTVTALPDMEIRCHSVNGAIHRRPGHCVIRPSTTKVVSEWEEEAGRHCARTWSRFLGSRLTFVVSSFSPVEPIPVGDTGLFVSSSRR